MKHILLYIGILSCSLSCTDNTPPLQAGDLLFQTGKNSEMSGAITAATAAEGTPNFTHVGIVLSADSVVEASGPGVRQVSLAEFLSRSATIKGHPVVVAMRLRDTCGCAKAVQRARELVGAPYDFAFLPDNDKYYCSELVWECYRRPAGDRIFPAQPMNFRAADGTMPQYWIDLFDELGVPIPEGVPGTNPNDLAQDSRLIETGRYF